ncbi:P-loop containing nucleoside triphosphate hydrolase protein [Suillus lakei]|nr:P-loop containing nucleoside triphosphate hydrolase protein [Suillus lakei]
MLMLSFNHVLTLSLSCHTKRKTGELLRILDRGSAVNLIGKIIGFTMIPVLVDEGIALVVFVVRFKLVSGIGVGVVTRRLARGGRWVGGMGRRDVVTRGFHTDCLLNYETIKYFSGEEYKAQRYAEAIGEYQSSGSSVAHANHTHSFAQPPEPRTNTHHNLRSRGWFLDRRVTRGQTNTGDFMFISYYVQLYFPLSNLGGVYHAINQSLIDTDKMLHLNEPTEVVDEPDAKELVDSNGEVEFGPRPSLYPSQSILTTPLTYPSYPSDNVSFAYDDQTSALHNLQSLSRRPCSARKRKRSRQSTILCLLYWFYDLQPGPGRILIDGQGIRTVMLSSLRCAIGVVLQDFVLFNATIGVQAVQMHDRIMSFPEGYEMKVGERGVRLRSSMLRLPRPWLRIQGCCFWIRLLACGWESFGFGLGIAPRLSAITGGDLIMVLKNGRIVEQDLHRELVELGGLFASMWADQISARPRIPKPQLDTTSLPPKVDAPISSPISDDPPQTFPTTASTSDSSSIHSHPERSAIPAHMQGANVTFDAPVTTPSRAGSPEPKRALSTHNIQRLARKISLSNKSPKLPGVLRRGRSMRDASTASNVAGRSVYMPPASGSARESVDEPQIKVVSKKEEKRILRISDSVLLFYALFPLADQSASL